MVRQMLDIGHTGGPLSTCPTSPESPSSPPSVQPYVDALLALYQTHQPKFILDASAIAYLNPSKTKGCPYHYVGKKEMEQYLLVPVGERPFGFVDSFSAAENYIRGPLPDIKTRVRKAAHPHPTFSKRDRQSTPPPVHLPPNRHPKDGGTEPSAVHHLLAREKHMASKMVFEAKLRTILDTIVLNPDLSLDDKESRAISAVIRFHRQDYLDKSMQKSIQKQLPIALYPDNLQGRRRFASLLRKYMH